MFPVKKIKKHALFLVIIKKMATKGCPGRLERILGYATETKRF